MKVIIGVGGGGGVGQGAKKWLANVAKNQRPFFCPPGMREDKEERDRKRKEPFFAPAAKKFPFLFGLVYLPRSLSSRWITIQAR